MSPCDDKQRKVRTRQKTPPAIKVWIIESDADNFFWQGYVLSKKFPPKNFTFCENCFNCFPVPSDSLSENDSCFLHFYRPNMYNLRFVCHVITTVVYRNVIVLGFWTRKIPYGGKTTIIAYITEDARVHQSSRTTRSLILVKRTTPWWDAHMNALIISGAVVL